MDAVQIGPFYVNWRLFSMIIGLIAAYGFIQFRVRRIQTADTGQISGLLVNAVLAGLLGWKLAPLLEQPSLLLSPLKLLMLQGGGRQAAVGIIVAAGYLLAALYRRRLPLEPAADLLAAGAAALLAVQGIVGGWRHGAPTSLPWGIVYHDGGAAYHPINAYTALIGLTLAVVLLLRYPHGDGRGASFVALGAGTSLLAVSLLGARPVIPPALGLSAAQWSYAGVIALGIILPALYKLWAAKRERRLIRMHSNDSAAQREHRRENEEAAGGRPRGGEGAGKRQEAEDNADKRLRGPNRPAE